MDGQVDLVLEQVGAETAVALVVAWMPRLVIATLILLLGWAAARALARLLQQVFERVKLDPTAGAFILTVVRFTVGIVLFLAALDQLGVDTTSILASLGVMGLTLGFAAQNTLSNIISGLFIFWDRPFVIGDLVEVDGLYGRIETITLRSTRLVTPDGRMVAIPNQAIANSRVASYTNFPNLRLDVPVTVAVDTDVSRARQLLLALVDPERGFMLEPAPTVVVKALADYNIELELRAWIVDEKQHIAMRFDLRERILETFTRHGVDMPFETLSLQPIHIKGQVLAAGT